MLCFIKAAFNTALVIPKYSLIFEMLKILAKLSFISGSELLAREFSNISVFSIIS